MRDIKGKNIAVLCDTEKKIRKFYSIFGGLVATGTFSCQNPKELYCKIPIPDILDGIVVADTKKKDMNY